MELSTRRQLDIRWRSRWALSSRRELQVRVRKRIACAKLMLFGSVDVYCYVCDDAKLDPHLAKHLGNFGIEVAAQTKTEKSMTELVRLSTSTSQFVR